MMGIVNVRQVDSDRILLTADATETLVSFRSENTSISGEVEALVAVPAAMSLGHPIEIDLPVSPGFADNFQRAQQVLAGWFPDKFTVMPLEADTAQPNPPAIGTVCFFSGGVDSFTSAVTSLERVDRLVLVHGFDIRLEEHEFRHRVGRSLEAAAADLGVPLIQVETDLREFGDRYMQFGTHYHGMSLAAVAHALGAGGAIIPSTYDYGSLFPWGSHPDLDPYFGSDSLPVEHHGSNWNRSEKVAILADSTVAMDHLRVCHQNPDEDYNCGGCEKCIRTMINLQIAGGLGRCRTLPASLDLGAVRRLDLRKHNAWTFAEENYRLLADRPNEKRLRRALGIARARARFDNAVRPYAAEVPGMRQAKRLWRRLR